VNAVGIFPGSGSGLGDGSGETEGSGEGEGLAAGDAEVGLGVAGGWPPHALIASATTTARIVVRMVPMVSVLRPPTSSPA
jgi:hypothetical protein